MCEERRQHRDHAELVAGINGEGCRKINRLMDNSLNTANKDRWRQDVACEDKYLS